MTEQERLTVPLTEIEMAELMLVCRDSLTTSGMLRLRRLAFEQTLLRNRVKELQKLLYRFVAHETAPCNFDHHGYCQEHGCAEPPCPVALGRRMLGLDK